MLMSEIASAAMEPYWSSEVDYQQARVEAMYGRSARRRHYVRRRRTLKLPLRRRRPLAVA